MKQLRVHIHVGMHQARWSAEALRAVVRMLAGDRTTPRIEALPLVCRAWIQLEDALKKSGQHEAEIMLYIGPESRLLSVSMRALGA